MGFELSEEYAKRIQERLEKTLVGEPIDGPEDPIESAPSTAKGKKRPKPFDERTEKIVTDAYKAASQGLSVDQLLCDKEKNRSFVDQCLDHKLGGNAEVWNSYLVELSKAQKWPEPAEPKLELRGDLLESIGFASEIAWKLLSIDYRKTLQEILCNPDFAEEFDRLAKLYSGSDCQATSVEYRQAALEIRKRSEAARKPASKELQEWAQAHRKLPEVSLSENLWHLGFSGVYVLYVGENAVFANESSDMQHQIETILATPHWRKLQIDRVKFFAMEGTLNQRYKVKAMLAQHHRTLMNCSLLVADSEIP
jgi:site-specific DNA-methyltransferase (adenine-specific)